MEEYPKEIEFGLNDQHAVAHTWSAKAGPMSFARASLKRDQGMIYNFAEGVTKTSEVVYYFHKSNISEGDLKNTMNYFPTPPVPHASAETYSSSEVYGRFSPRSEDFPGFDCLRIRCAEC